MNEDVGIEELFKKYMECVRKFYKGVEAEDVICYEMLGKLVTTNPRAFNQDKLIDRIEKLRYSSFVKEDESGYYSAVISKKLRDEGDYPKNMNTISLMLMHDEIIRRFF